MDIYGEACCHWEEENESLQLDTSKSDELNDNLSTASSVVHFTGRSVVFSSRIFLLGFEGSQAIQLPSGTYSYDFAVHLPDSLPASIATSHGYIRYYIEAVLDLPPRFDKKFKLQFNVARRGDLADHPELKLPCLSEEIKQFCSFLCKSEALALTVMLPHSGFAPGHSIPVTVSYFNQSDAEVEKTKISLKQIIRYKR